MVAMKQLIC